MSHLFLFHGFSGILLSKEEKAKEALGQRAVDYDLESDLDYTLDLQIGKWKSTVREFMGGGSEWEDYTDFASGKLKAKIIIMARQGKLPAWLINFGVSLPLAEDTLLEYLKEIVNDQDEEWAYKAKTLINQIKLLVDGGDTGIV